MGCGTSTPFPLGDTKTLGMAAISKRPSKSIRDSIGVGIGPKMKSIANGLEPVMKGNGINKGSTPRRESTGLKDDAQLAAEGAQGVLDSRLPLARRDVFLLTKSWKTIARNMDVTGVKVFTKIFINNPELLKLFKNIKVEKSQLNNPLAYENNMELETHSEIVINTLDEAISCFGEYEKCYQVLTSIGAYHYTIRGFKGEYFMKAEEPLMDAVKEVLGDRFTPQIEKIYRTAIHFILKTLAHGYDIGKEQSSTQQLEISSQNNIPTT